MSNYTKTSKGRDSLVSRVLREGLKRPKLAWVGKPLYGGRFHSYDALTLIGKGLGLNPNSRLKSRLSSNLRCVAKG